MQYSNSKVILPINTNTSITSECWTYNKLAIIETSPYASSWLASHFELYFDNNFNVFFGKYNDLYHLDYFNEILQYEEIPIQNIDAKKIVDLIINEIINMNYVVVYLPHDRTMIHEIILHGFDIENRCFFYTDIINGKFRETSISFEAFEIAHNKVYEYFKAHPFSRIVTSWYFFPITRLKLKKYDDDLCLLRAINKLHIAADGKQIVFSNLDSNGKVLDSNIHYSGIAAYIGLEKRMNEYIRDKQYITGDVFVHLSNQLINTLYKFYEFQKIVHNSMRWISAELDAEEQLESYITSSEKYLDRISKLYMMAIKFGKTEQWDVFYKLYNDFKDLYRPLKSIIMEFCCESDTLMQENNKIK